MTETILAFNGYGGSNKEGTILRHWVTGLGANVALVCELGRLDDDLSRIGMVYDAGDHPKDCAVVLVGRDRKPWGIFEVNRVRLTRKVPRNEKPLLWRDRWYVRVRRWNRVYYSTHGNAVIQNKETGEWLENAGAREWQRGLLRLQEDILRDLEKGRRVRVGVDFNFRRSPVDLSPNRIFDALGMEYINHGLMWLAWNPAKDELVRSRVLGKAPGADAHHALLVTLRKRKRKRKFRLTRR